MQPWAAADGVGHQPRLAPCNPVWPHLGAQRGGPGHQQTHQICHRRTGDENTAGRVWELKQLAHPANDLALHFDRHLVAAAKIGVESGRQHVGEHPHGRAATMHPAHEAWMHIAHGVRQHIVHEALVRGGKAAGRIR